MNVIIKLLGINSDFEKLFYLNEYKTLSGEKKQIILALIFILFLTLLALGYAVGSIQNLERKMNNPFTNWVNLSIKSKFIADKVYEINEDYSSEEKKEFFQLKDVRGWVNFNLEMYHQSFNPVKHTIDTLAYSTWGRDLETDDPLWSMILAKDNLLWKDSSLTYGEEGDALADCEMIISEGMLERMGYDSGDEAIGHIFVREDDAPFAIKIVGVVKELPKFCDFISSPKLYNIKEGKRDDVKECYDLLIKNKDGNSVFTFIVDAKLSVAKIKALAKQFFQVKEQPEIRIAEQLVSGKKAWGICEVSFLPSDSPSLDSVKQFSRYSKEKGTPLSEIHRLECESSDFCDEINFVNYHYLAFNFNRLNDIRKFKDDMKENHQVEIDMSQVEAKENFALVSRLTLVISLILLGFGILSIILFVNSLLRSHLFKVRSNLGTFKAFGLSNKFLNSIYLKIIFSFLVLSIMIALGATIIIDRIEQFITLEESKFNIFSSWVLFSMIALVLISLFISYKTIKRILGDTPGNLIYER